MARQVVKVVVRPAPRMGRLPIAFTLPPEIIAGIDDVATGEGRSRNKMIEIILRRFLQMRQGLDREAA
jgi:hypothetical protein